MTDKGKIAKLTEEYTKHAHRVQTAIASIPDHPKLSAKHMRTGIDTSKSDMGGLATLLIAKGIITHEEYLQAVTDAMKREADSLEDELSVLFGINIRTL